MEYLVSVYLAHADMLIVHRLKQAVIPPIIL